MTSSGTRRPARTSMAKLSGLDTAAGPGWTDAELPPPSMLRSRRSGLVA